MILKIIKIIFGLGLIVLVIGLIVLVIKLGMMGYVGYKVAKVGNEHGVCVNVSDIINNTWVSARENVIEKWSQVGYKVAKVGNEHGVCVNVSDIINNTWVSARENVTEKWSQNKTFVKIIATPMLKMIIWKGDLQMRILNKTYYYFSDCER